MLCLKPWNAVSLQLCLFTIGAESVPCSSWDGHSGTEWILMLISCYEDFWCSAGGCVCFDCPECSVGEFHFSVLFWVIPGCPEYTRFSSDSSHEVLRLHGGADMPCSLWVTCLSFLLSTDPELLLGVIKKKRSQTPYICFVRAMMYWSPINDLSNNFIYLFGSWWSDLPLHFPYTHSDLVSSLLWAM